ncbi:MAG: ACT domain-containing protein [Candidatus Diapherotrites archaeon]|nr:ACT domain-containing protein [Candidatus Diapherotrites archaeon]
METVSVRLDEKGRVIVPNSFREMLGLRTGEEMVLQFDPENGRLILFPLEKGTRRIRIVFGDIPGSLHKAAGILARHQVNILYSESRTRSRGKEAEWEVTGDFSKTDPKKLAADLKKEPAIRKFTFH